jgi:hypothetical protein
MDSHESTGGDESQLEDVGVEKHVELAAASRMGSETFDCS